MPHGKTKVTFKTVRVAEDGWTIQADYPGSVAARFFVGRSVFSALAIAPSATATGSAHGNARPKTVSLTQAKQADSRTPVSDSVNFANLSLKR